MRYAIFFLPEPDSEIAALGARWLGRHMETGARFGAPDLDAIDASTHARITSGPRRYGFHATLKAPFGLAEGRTREELIAAFRGFSRSVSPVRIPVLSLARLRGVFALVPAINDSDLEMLGSDAEHHFEPFRAPLTPQEAQRRAAGGLTSRQARHLERYGYPFVLDEFRFHLTLTGPLANKELALLAGALEEFFQPVIGRGLLVDRVALVMETAPASEFVVLAVAPLGDPLAYMRRAVHVEAHYGETGHLRPSARFHGGGN